MTDGLREAYRHQLIALRALRREIARQDRMLREILDAVRDSDEAQTSFGQAPCCDPRPIAAGLETRTHDFAPRPEPCGFCSEAMDDLDEGRQ